MLATRWEPFAEMHRLSQEMDRLFGRYGNGSGQSLEAYPAINIWEDENQTFLEAELPGYDAEKLEVFVQGNQLTLRGERMMPEHDGGKWHRRERSPSSFSRVIELAHDVKEDDLSADYKNGVLTVTLPKSEAAKPVRISVKSH